LTIRSLDVCTCAVACRGEIYRILFAGQDVLEAVIVTGFLDEGAL